MNDRIGGPDVPGLIERLSALSETEQSPPDGPVPTGWKLLRAETVDEIVIALCELNTRRLHDEVKSVLDERRNEP